MLPEPNNFLALEEIVGARRSYMTSRAMSNPLLSSYSSCFVFTKHPVHLKTVTTCFQNMFFSKRAPKQKGGCLDTLDTPWIRHWNVDRFSKFFHWQIHICVSVTETFTSPLLSCYITLWNLRQIFRVLHFPAGRGVGISSKDRDCQVSICWSWSQWRWTFSAL